MKINNELVELDDSENGDYRVKFLDDGAPAKDRPHSWDQSVFERVETLMLEQVKSICDSKQDII